MVGEDKLYNRTLSPKMPYTGFFDSVEAYKFRVNQLVQIDAAVRSGQDFRSYATAFESVFSALYSPELPGEPVINENWEVMGHYLWISGYNIFTDADSLKRLNRRPGPSAPDLVGCLAAGARF